MLESSVDLTNATVRDSGPVVLYGLQAQSYAAASARDRSARGAAMLPRLYSAVC